MVPGEIWEKAALLEDSVGRNTAGGAAADRSLSWVVSPEAVRQVHLTGSRWKQMCHLCASLTSFTMGLLDQRGAVKAAVLSNMSDKQAKELYKNTMALSLYLGHLDRWYYSAKLDDFIVLQRCFSVTDLVAAGPIKFPQQMTFSLHTHRWLWKRLIFYHLCLKCCVRDG